MTPTALQQRAGAANARLGSYSGAETVAAFTDPLNELRAITSGCGLFDLGWRSKITVKGRDRVRWLNGMITNTIKDLPANHGNYSFVLNPQGRILGDLYAYNRGDFLVLDTDRAQLEGLLGILKRFIIMDQVELADAGEALSAVGVCGPAAEEILSAAGMSVAGLKPLELRDLSLSWEQASVTVVRGPEPKPGWYELWASSGVTDQLWNALAKAGAQPAGTEALELWRILRGIPRYGQDIRERDLPQETEQAQALNFTKGCYIGQEIVERIRSRGQVHRKFTGFEFPESLPQTAKFEENGRVVAEITSAAQVGARKFGLGYVRREAASPGTELTLGEIKAVVTDIPFQVEWS